MDEVGVSGRVPSQLEEEARVVVFSEETEEQPTGVQEWRRLPVPTVLEHPAEGGDRADARERSALRAKGALRLRHGKQRVVPHAVQGLRECEPEGGREAEYERRELFFGEIEPCYVFHELNAFRDGDVVVVDVCRYPRMMDGERFGDVPLALHRWRIDTGGEQLAFSDEVLEDSRLEFPAHDRRFTGRPNRYGWFVEARNHPDTIDQRGIYSLDHQTGLLDHWDPGPNRHCGEAFFVAGDTGEGEGWLLTLVYDHAAATSDLVILDATRISRGPVATIHLPRRVPFGFHGVWVPD